MSIDSRLSKLAPVLTARERAVLILQSWQEDRPEEPAWRRTMPQSQAVEFNRYIALMNATNRFLANVIGYLERSAKEIALRQAWLVALTLWQEHLDEIERAFRLSFSEPITESEYRAKVDASRAEFVPVDDLTSWLANDRNDWKESDYEEDEELGRGIKEDIWERACDEQERWIREQVAAGRLPGKGRGKSLKVECGAFDDLVGHRSAVCSEDFLSYRVLSDDQAEEVEAERKRLLHLQTVMGDWSFDADEGDLKLNFPGVMQARLREAIAHDLISTWVEVRCMEIILDEVAGEFGGVDPLKPAPREKLEDTKRSLLNHQQQLEVLRLVAVFRDPLPEELEEFRGFFDAVVARE